MPREVKSHLYVLHPLPMKCDLGKEFSVDPFYRCSGVLVSLRLKGVNYFLVVGFGYPYATNEYKIIRIYYSSICREAHVQVFTLGDKSGRWRNTRTTDHYLRRFDFEYSHGILFDGALHWIKNTGKEIVALDLATEKFRFFPIPTCILLRDNYRYPQLLLLGGYLSIAFLGSSMSTEIWSLKTMKDPKLESFHEFTIHAKDVFPASLCDPIALKDENNKVILWDIGRGKRLGHYDPKTAALEELAYEKFKVSRVIPYMKRDVSLTVLAADLPAVNWDS